MKYKIKKDEINKFNETVEHKFPKYTTQLINLANQNAQGTRPARVGQMSELFPEFLSKSVDEINIDNWYKWYINKYPNTIDEATDRIIIQIENLKEAIPKINRDMVRDWVEDLIINKTFNGMYFQKAILASLSEKKGKTYRLANIAEEARGIDGYVGSTAYSIKPDTYKSMSRLSESIDVKMIYYSYDSKTHNLTVEIEE